MITASDGMTAEQVVGYTVPGKRVELVRGQLVVREPASFRHGDVGLRLGIGLGNHLAQEQQTNGWATKARSTRHARSWLHTGPHSGHGTGARSGLRLTGAPPRSYARWISAFARQFDVTPDGTRFLMSRGVSDGQAHVVVVFNFVEELKRHAARL